MLQAALELVDACGRLVEQPALDVVPLTEPPVELDHGGRVLLVVLRPAIEDAAQSRVMSRETRLEILQRVLRLAKLLEGDVDLLELQVQFGFALLDRMLRDRRVEPLPSPRMIRTILGSRN